jgi:hypothetical protein
MVRQVYLFAVLSITSFEGQAVATFFSRGRESSRPTKRRRACAPLYQRQKSESFRADIFTQLTEQGFRRRVSGSFRKRAKPQPADLGSSLLGYQQAYDIIFHLIVR